MKIVVVYYEEYGFYRSEKEVLDDIIEFWNSANERTRLEVGRHLRNQLDELSKNKECDIVFQDTTDIIRPFLAENLKKTQIDLLVTYNLAGFELCTLTDGLAYNLVNCRQFHFITEEKCFESEYLKKLRSMNMFIIKR